ncbi:Rho GTPase-activating protein 15 [Orchesella cincta]|uniref:Rho GTPase-activating protein 15 n=1 Tax=Orchesella cincta TaxID=48709 RepID=A0A1D2N9K5_ORCCI|nr:Rho GTPase-activating protein 15 [Orchesella cincta]
MKSKDSSDGSLDNGGPREPVPIPKGPPLRLLSDNWAEYFSPEKGRYFYYNAEERKTSWKPPRSSSNRRSDECLASGRSMSTFGSSSIEDSLDNLYEEVNDSMDVNNSISCSSGSNINIATSGLPLPKPDILQIPSSVCSSRKSVAVSTEEINITNSPEKSHNNDNSGTHGSSSSVFDSQENLDRSPNHHQNHEDEEASCSTELSLANLTASIPIPEGWEECWDESLQQLYHVNKVTGAKWLATNDPQGKIYFYEENSSQSSWFLPEVQVNSGEGNAQKGSNEQTQAINSNSTSNSEEVLSFGTVKKRHSAGDAIDRGTKSKSLFLPDYRGESLRSRHYDSLPRVKVSIWLAGHTNSIIREGQLGRTKITEGGKKVRKNWGVVYAVLTESHLSLFKDQKSFTAHKSELEVELNGSTVEWTEEKSSRKNVFQLNSRSDLQMLFQSEDKNIAMEWFEDIKGISESYLPVDISMRLRSTECPETLLDPPIGERKISSRLYRNKSTKIKITPADEMGADRKKITANLKKFFSRRPPRESLVKKGIYKEKRTVPLFVEECILAIEQKEENLKTDGIYRASGNLSQVQKIRLQVDQNNFQCLYQEEDVHVLAGSLKLFFREMREPLISYDLFEKSFEAINSNKKDKVTKFRDIVKNLAKPNRDTLQALLRHLLKIADYAEFNRMMVPNLAIVFGPTLMWPAMESKNMALDLMQQNYVIEALLVDFVSIFQ